MSILAGIFFLGYSIYFSEKIIFIDICSLMTMICSVNKLSTLVVKDG